MIQRGLARAPWHKPKGGNECITQEKTSAKAKAAVNAGRFPRKKQQTALIKEIYRVGDVVHALIGCAHHYYALDHTGSVYSSDALGNACFGILPNRTLRSTIIRELSND